MPVVESYFSYFSIRLGSIISGGFALIQSLATVVLSLLWVLAIPEKTISALKTIEGDNDLSLSPEIASIIIKVLEFIRFIFLTAAHIMGMILIRQYIASLGILIGATVAGSFFLMLVIYNWACVLSLYQVLKGLGIEGPPENEETPIIRVSEASEKTIPSLNRPVGIAYDIRNVRRNYQEPRYGQLISPLY